MSNSDKYYSQLDRLKAAIDAKASGIGQSEERHLPSEITHFFTDSAESDTAWLGCLTKPNVFKMTLQLLVTTYFNPYKIFFNLILLQKSVKSA